MHGARLVTQYGLGPVFDGMGIIHPVFSYCGRISVAFTSDRNIMPDPENYANCLQESFEELKAAALKKPIPAPKIEPVPVAPVAEAEVLHIRFRQRVHEGNAEALREWEGLQVHGDEDREACAIRPLPGWSVRDGRIRVAPMCSHVTISSAGRSA